MHADWCEQEDSLWQLVAGDDESTADGFGDFSDDEDAGSFAGVETNWEGNSTDNDHHGCYLRSALLMSKPEEGSIHDRDIGKLWDPNQGECRGQDGAALGQMAEIAAMVIMTVMYPARVARFDLLRSVCFLARRIPRWD